MTYNNKNTRRDEMPLPAWIFSYSPFDAVGIQPQDMLPRPPAPEVFRHSLHAALYVAKEAAQRDIHVPYTLTEVWLAGIYLQQTEAAIGHETPDHDAWAWNFDLLVVRGAGARYTRRWAPERIRPGAATVGTPLTFDLSPFLPRSGFSTALLLKGSNNNDSAITQQEEEDESDDDDIIWVSTSTITSPPKPASTCPTSRSQSIPSSSSVTTPERITAPAPPAAQMPIEQRVELALEEHLAGLRRQQSSEFHGKAGVEAECPAQEEEAEAHCQESPSDPIQQL